MENSLVDLHLHTNLSDGIFTPEETVRYARQFGISAIAITDHDITDGIAPAIKESEKTGVEVIAGVELSVECEQSYQKEMHILGYFIEWQNPKLQEKIGVFREARKLRANTIMDKLLEIGINLDREGIFKDITGSVGRLHIARSLVKEKYVKNIKEAFNKYLSPNKPAYVPKFHLTFEDAISLIKENNGISSLAHPYFLGRNYEEIIKELVDKGLDAVEIWHSMQSDTVRENLKLLADKLNIGITGGSDCHGVDVDGNPSIGNQKVPYSVLVELKKKHSQSTG